MAGSGTEVARAYVTIIPKSDGTSAAVVNSVVNPLAKGGADAGAKASGAFGAAFGAGVAKAGAALGALGLAAGVGSFAKESVEAGARFDSAMSQVAATMGTTTDKIGDLRDFAKEMGSTTAFSATEAAEALNYMALAGYDSETSMKMLPNVLNLAAAGGMELAQASDMVTDTQSALGLSLDETTELVDKMAATASTTNTSVGQLGDALLTVGGTAKSLSGGTTEAAQALGILADNGIKGSEGGTALRNVLLGLSSDKFEKTFGALGVSAYDAQGKMRSLKDIFGDMNAAMKDMTVEEKTKALSSAFNKVDLKSLNAMLGTNAERWDEVAAAIDGSKGAAQAMADTQLDNLEGDVTLFKSALEGLQISLAELVTPALRGFVQVGTAGLGAIQTAVQGAQQFFGAFVTGLKSTIDASGFAEAFRAIGDAVASAFGSGPALDAQSFGAMVGEMINMLLPVVQLLAPVFGSVASAVSSAWGIMSAAVGQVLDFIVTQVAPFITQAIQSLAPVAQQMFVDVGGAFNAVREAIGSALGAVMGVVRDVWPAISSIVRAAIDVIRTVVPPAWNLVKSVVSTVMNAVRGIVETAWPVISGVVKTAADAIGGAVNGMRALVGVASDIFGGIRAAIEDPIGTAQRFIGDAVAAIRGFFDFDIQWPHVPLPHFEVWGSPNPLDWIEQGPPGFSIEWYGKGGFADSATLVGYGERGIEMFWPGYAPYFDKYARGIAEHMPASRGVDIHDCTFVVREKDDIRRVAQELNTIIERQEAIA